MTKEIVKAGFELAEKEAREKSVNEVKLIVQRTLEKIEDVDKQIEQARDSLKKLEDQKKILKLDIEDLKDGKLDRIVERQEKDPEAKRISVVLIIKEKETIREVNPWYWPYQIFWQSVPTYQPTIVCTNGSYPGSFTDIVGNTTNYNCDYINCSVAKDATVGTYLIEGHAVHLR